MTSRRAQFQVLYFEMHIDPDCAHPEVTPLQAFEAKHSLNKTDVTSWT